MKSKIAQNITSLPGICKDRRQKEIYQHVSPCLLFIISRLMAGA
jgi:hypothetical protein